MKILRINKYYYVRGGAERYMFNVSSLLKSYGHQIISFSMQHERNIPTKYSKYFVKNIEIDKELRKNILRKIYIGFKVIYSFEARNKITKLIDRENPDIAHLHKFNNILTPSILYPLKKKGVPVVHDLHDYRIVCPNYNMYDFNKFEVCEDCKGHKYFNALRRKCQKSSYLASLNASIESYLYHFLKTYENCINLFIAPSNFMRKKMIEFGVDEEKIIHIPRFIQCNKYIPNYNNSNYILYFGRIERHKGVKTLIEAMRYVRSSKLYIVGEGTYQNKLREKCKESSLRNVVFLGYKTEEELMKIVRNSLFTVVPSEWYENSPNVVLESFVLGKPVVGSNIGGIPELVDDGVDGMLFKAGDANDLAEKINYLLSHKDMVIAMGRNARKKVEEKYNEDIHYNMLMEAYKKVI